MTKKPKKFHKKPSTKELDENIEKTIKELEDEPVPPKEEEPPEEAPEPGEVEEPDKEEEAPETPEEESPVDYKKKFVF